MELPIVLAIDTTEAWNKSDTVLAASELAIEIAGKRQDGTLIKYLLVGDGKAVGPNGAGQSGRLRATPELIAGLPENLQGLAAGIAAEENARIQAINAEANTRAQADLALQKSIDTQVASESSARKQADQALQKSIDTQIDNEAQAREHADQTLQSSIDTQIANEAKARQLAVANEAEARILADQGLQNSIDTQIATEVKDRNAAIQGAFHIADNKIDGEIQRATLAEQALEDAKMDKSVAGETGRLMQTLDVKEATTNSVIMAYDSVNVDSGAVTETEIDLPMASLKQAGMMPAESFRQVDENMVRIASLENRGVHYHVTLSSATPSQTELQAAYEEASGSSSQAGDQVTLDDTAFQKSYTWFQSKQEWVDMGSTLIPQFTNDSLGIIKGDNTEGKVFAENDGSGSVVGWSGLKSRVSNAESAIGAMESEQANGLPVGKGGTGAKTAAEARQNLGVAPAGHLHNGMDSEQISYLELKNKPNIPAAQVNADWTAESGVQRILNRPSVYTKTDIDALNSGKANTAFIDNPAIFNSTDPAALQSGIYSISSGSVLGLSANWYHIIHMRHRDNNGYNAQIAIPLDGAEAKMFFRNSLGTSWSGWKCVYPLNTATTSQSGLMAAADKTKLDAHDAALPLKAPLASPWLTGTPTAPEITNIPYIKNPDTDVLNIWGNQIVVMNTLRNAIRDRVFPKNSYYTQYADFNLIASESPAQLYGGTWTLLFNNDGAYFQTEDRGTNLPRTMGLQKDAIRNLWGTAKGTKQAWSDVFGCFGLEGTSNYITGGETSRTPNVLVFDTSKYIPDNVDTVTHPINRIIRVWKRTA